MFTWFILGCFVRPATDPLAGPPVGRHPIERLSTFSDAGWVRCPLPEGRLSTQLRMSDLGVRMVDGDDLLGLVEQPVGVTLVLPRLDLSACDEGDQGCKDAQQAEVPLGAYRWEGALPGKEGRCRFETAETVTFPGRFELPEPLAPGDSVFVVGCEGVRETGGEAFTVTGIEGVPCRLSASNLLDTLQGYAEVMPAAGEPVVVRLEPRLPNALPRRSGGEVALDRALAGAHLSEDDRVLFKEWKRAQVDSRARRANRKARLDALEAEVDALLKELQ